MTGRKKSYSLVLGALQSGHALIPIRGFATAADSDLRLGAKRVVAASLLT